MFQQLTKLFRWSTFSLFCYLQTTIHHFIISELFISDILNWTPPKETTNTIKVLRKSWKIRDLKSNKYADLPGTVFRSSDSNKVRLYNRNFLHHTTHRQACLFQICHHSTNTSCMPNETSPPTQSHAAKNELRADGWTDYKIKTNTSGRKYRVCNSNILKIFIQGFKGNFISYLFWAL